MGTGNLSLAAIAALLPLISGGSAGANPLEVCVDYGCDVTRQVRLRQDEKVRLASLFSGNSGAPAERRAVALAVGQLESIIGERAGTADDAPRNSARDGGIGQLDCIAESTNTLAYLEWLDAAGMLNHHRPAGREVRHRWLFATHWTAVLKDSVTGERYAVDSWYGANGDPAIVIPITAWRRGELPPYATR